MNNGAQGQPSGGQQRPAQPITIYKPEQMRSLPDNFTQAEKDKWENGLRNLYSQIAKYPEGTQQHTDAKRKLFDFSRTLAQKLQNIGRGQQSGGVARPASQGQPAAQDVNTANPNPTNLNPSASQPSQQAPQARSQIPAKILEHVHKFPYTVPTHLTPGTPEANKWIQEAKSRYVKGLMTMDSTTANIAKLDNMQKKRAEEGRPLSPEEEQEFREKKEAAMKLHTDAKQFIDSFRAQQQREHQAQNANGQSGNQQQGGSGQPPNRGPMSATQPQNPALNTQTVNAAIEAARNQQMAAGRPPMQQNGLGSQTPNQSAPSIPQHQGGQVQHIKQEAGVPQINTQMQGRPMQTNSPQSAVPQSAQSVMPQSALSNPQVPRALTHPQALQQASRTYSSGQTSRTPNVMGHSHTHPSAPRETQNVITNKMPIPKHLPERAVMPPQPVAMPNARPTYSGGANHSNSVIGQPVLHKAPGFNMEGEGDRVLNKKKLDELVRQVTGGGEGLGGGEALTPEVEEVCLIIYL